MDNITHNELKKRSFASTLSLFFQSGYAAVLGLVANLIVTILLSPQIFGIYVTVLSLINLLNYFSDFGLAASIIQKKNLQDEDVTTTFTIQQILATILVLIGFAATGAVTNFYKLPSAGTYLYWALLFGFFISSFKTIPSVFLERHIKFQRIVFVQVIENTIFYATVSICAIAGLGLQSFTIAVILRAIVGLILIFILSPWKPKIGISRQSTKELLSFGLPFQASSFLALFKDDLIILFLGKVLGFELLGYIGWAKKWADAPLRIIMDNVSKVIFPLISRVQDDKEKLKRISERLLYYQTALLAPVIIGMSLTIRIFVALIPNYQKWSPALPLFYILMASSLILSFSAPFMNLYNALGKVKTTLSFMILLTVVMWLGTPLLTKLIGMYGFPITHFFVSLSLGGILIQAKRLLKLQIWHSIHKPLISAVCMGIFVYATQILLHNINIVNLISSVIVGAATYYISIRYVFGIKITDEIKFFTHPHE